MLASTEMEFSYAAYQDRQRHEVSLDGLRTRAAKLAPGGKFRFQTGQWQPQAYQGHAVVTMVAGSAANETLGEQLRWIQNELSYGFAEPSALYLLPEASFHQTVANTLSDEKYRRLVIERNLAASYPMSVADTFADLPPSLALEPLTMRMIGLSIFSTAIGLLGIFDAEEDFRRVLHFRDHFYGHERIGRLGIRRTRPFVGHITLAYIERLLESDERSRLVETVSAINHGLAERDLRFHLRQAELRAYDHLAEFKALPGLPVYRF